MNYQINVDRASQLSSLKGSVAQTSIRFHYESSRFAMAIEVPRLFCDSACAIYLSCWPAKHLRALDTSNFKLGVPSPLSDQVEVFMWDPEKAQTTDALENMDYLRQQTVWNLRDHYYYHHQLPQSALPIQHLSFH